MKNDIKFLLLVVISTLVLNCSSDSESSEDNDNQPNTKKHIKTVISQNPDDWEKPTQFIYENDKLKYVYLDDCSGELYYFEYNNDVKISKSYRVGYVSFEEDNFNPNNFDLDSFKQNSEVLNYVYEGGKIIKIQYNDDFIDYQFSYNSDNKLEVIEWILADVGLWEKVVLTYSNGKISNLNKQEFDTDGSPHDNYNYTFEFDDNPNPFYVLAENFSLLNLYTCTGFDYISSEDIGLKLFANNVKAVYRDGTLLYSATYQYDDDNYPIRISYTNMNGNYSGVDLITYLEK